MLQWPSQSPKPKPNCNISSPFNVSELELDFKKSGENVCQRCAHTCWERHALQHSAVIATKGASTEY